ncbi:hypothetical protein [Sphingomonas sp. SORGH_AS_0438]|uniref:hypothetical protein n=1 Tax=Sphingomonas sp. SORGH_AS_0438 TaxID=3041756 RepID=UPI002856B5B6|nr:hypothetical protein [Sphingomonas sp. SORGH_AS_0438]MDR6128046.1 hypothetical protein [Sphingomonas sp. SORGH_AS_0438]
MKEDIKKALNGTLRSENIVSTKVTVHANNDFPMQLQGYTVLKNGYVVANMGLIDPHSKDYSFEVLDKSYFIWKERSTGAFVHLIEVDSEAGKLDVSIPFHCLLRPGEIGDLPKPEKDIMIPANSSKVAVSCGAISGGYIVRYQYWKCTENSYCLPDGVSRTVTLNLTSGMTNMSSKEEVISQAVSSSADLGWGPISASISMSLENTTTISTSFELNEQETRTDTLTISNNTGKTAYYLAWQLMDCIQTCECQNSVRVTSSILNAVAPLLYDGPFEVNKIYDGNDDKEVIDNGIYEALMQVREKNSKGR